jgi:hypothetical protein
VNKSRRGVIPLLVIAIIAAVALIGGGVALTLAEPNGLVQLAGCVAGAAAGNPAAVTTIGQALGAASLGPAESAVIALFGPLAKCIVLDFYNDIEGKKVAALAAQGATISHPEMVQLNARAYLTSVGVKVPPPLLSRVADAGR